MCRGLNWKFNNLLLFRSSSCRWRCYPQLFQDKIRNIILVASIQQDIEANFRLTGIKDVGISVCFGYFYQ